MEEKKPKDFMRAKTPEELVDILMETASVNIFSLR